MLSVSEYHLSHFMMIHDVNKNYLHVYLFSRSVADRSTFIKVRLSAMIMPILSGYSINSLNTLPYSCF